MNRVISVVLSGNSSSLRAQLGLAARAIDDLDTTGKRVGASLKIALAAAATAVAAAFAYVVKSSAEFDAAMRNVNSISGMTEQAFGALEAKVLALAKSGEVTQSATTLAKGLYDIASSGFQGAEGLEVLTQAAKAASAGLTDTQTSAKAITAVLNAYGLEAEDAGHVSDVLFQTVNLGVVSFEELATQLGDVVGGAAAAGVSIEQVGGAVAAMTLSGISAAESTTSLNRLITALIKPSDALAATFRSLGINIVRDLKDPAIGLYGVMEKLRVATGGNIEAFLALFPEIRAARGAFALAANDGENYRRAMAGIADQSNVTGATQRALDEQMKSLSSQWRIFVNRINAGATELGLRFIPALVDTLTTAQRFGREGIAFIAEQIRRLGPALGDLRQHFLNIVEILKNLWEALGPVATGIAALGGGVAIAALTTLASALEAISGFLADNEGAVTTLAIATGILLLPALISAAAAMAANVAVTVAWRIQALATSASLVTLRGAIAGLAVAGAAIALGVLVTQLQKAKSGAQEFYQSIVKDFDLTTYRGLSDALAEIGLQQQKLEEDPKTHGGWLNAFKGLVDPSINKAREDLKLLNKQVAEKLAPVRINVFSNLTEVAKQTGLTRDKVEALAQWAGVDLTKSFAQSEPERDKLIASFKKMQEQAGPAAVAMVAAGKISVDQLEAMAKAAEEAKEATRKAFATDTDLISGYSAAVKEQEQGSESLLSARKRLADAEDRLSDTRQRQSADDKDTVSDQVSLRNALDEVAEANDGVAKAQAEISRTGLTGFFARTKKEAEDFVTNVRTAAEKGLDPHLIQSLLQAGPAAAAPVLEAIAADHSGNLVKQFNDTQAALNEISTLAVEFARLTHQAVSSESDVMVRDLSNAMKLAELNMRDGGKRSATALAEELKIGVDEVARIAKEYGITLAAGIDPVLIGVGAEPIRGSSAFYHDRTAMAEGGHLPNQAKYQKAGTMVQWAEPETGGEWFLPESAHKRGRSLAIAEQMLAGWGYEIRKREFADGGYRSSSDVDRVPDFSQYGNAVGYSGERGSDAMFRAVVAYLDAHPAGAGLGSLSASSNGLNPDFLDRFNRWNESLGNILSITSGFRSSDEQQYLYDLYLSGEGNLAAKPGSSMHEKGLAIDHSPSWEGMDEEGATRFGLRHPVTSPQRETWHVEPFDRGGWLQPGLTMAYNGTGRPEAVGGGAIDYDRLAQCIAREMSNVSVRGDVVMDKVKFGEVASRALQDRRASYSGGRR